LQKIKFFKSKSWCSLFNGLEFTALKINKIKK